MKKMLAIVLVAIFAVACHHQEKNKPFAYTDSEIFNMKGDIDFIRDSFFVVDSAEKIVPDSLVYEVGTFKNRMFDHWMSYDTTGKNIDSTVYNHYPDGKYKGSETFTNGTVTSSEIVHLDSAGAFSTMEISRDGKILLYRDLKENEYGQLLSGRRIDADGKLRGSFIDVYDKNFQLSSKTMDSLGNVKKVFTFKRNDKGDVIEQITEKPGGDSSSTERIKYRYDSYDATGNWTQMTELSADNKPRKITIRKITYVVKPD